MSKDPQRVEWGRQGAMKRYGRPPKTLRMDALTPAQRELVLARVRAYESANARADTDTKSPV